MPHGLQSIGNYAFKDTKMKNVEFPSTLTTIGYAAFMNCSGWTTTLTIPASVSTLGGYAFCNTDVQKVVIKDGSLLTSFEVCAFGSTEGPTSWTTAANTTLKEIKFEGSSRITSIGAYAFNKYQALEAFTCPPNVTTIGRSAFEECTSLKEFVFPPALRTIVLSAFYKTGLETIDLRNTNLDYVGSTAFAYCPVTNILFPDDKRIRLDYESFRDCHNLTEVTLPALVQEVSGGSFNFCSNLMNYYVKELPENASQADKNFRFYSSVGGYLLTSDKEKLVAFPEAKANTKFTLLPPSIRDIGDYAFYSCEKLENVVIPNKVTNISGVRAFGLCPNLKTITFLCDEMISPSAIEQRSGKQAFDENSLAGKTVYVRKKLLSQYQDCDFYNVANLVPSFEEDVREFRDWESGKRSDIVDGEERNGNAEVNEYINVSDDYVSLLSTKSKDYTFVLPETITHTYDGTGEKTLGVAMIGDYAFQDAPADIKEVVVPQNIGYIGGNAFVTHLAAEDDELDDNESTIKRVFFINNAPEDLLSTARFRLRQEDLVGGKDYNEFTPSQKIYVKRSMVDRYKAAWPIYGEQGLIDYKITNLDIKPSGRFGVFCREFDTDICEEEDGSRVKDIKLAAFTTGKWVKYDIDESTEEWVVRMVSIYTNDEGTYIPKDTPVLWAVINTRGEADHTKYYYCIGERDDERLENPEDNIMGGSTITKLPLDGGDGNTYWLMQNDAFHPLGAGVSYNLPVHRAYLTVPKPEPPVSGGAAKKVRLRMTFEDSGVSTGLEDIVVDVNPGQSLSEALYSLSGMRIDKPGKGVYIKNGRKYVKK